MKKGLIVLFLLSLISIGKANEDLVSIRNLFYRAAQFEDSNDTLIEVVKNFKAKETPEIKGYEAMYNFMLAYHAYNPYKKFKGFIDGKDIIDNTIINYPENIELRFLRLTVQLNTPAFLMYKDNIEEDKNFILNHAKNVNDLDLFKRLYDYSTSAKKLTEDEKKALKKKLAENPFYKQISFK